MTCFVFHCFDFKFKSMTLMLPDVAPFLTKQSVVGLGLFPPEGQNGPSAAQIRTLSSSSPSMRITPFGPPAELAFVLAPAKAGVAVTGNIVSFFRVSMMSTDWFDLSVSP